MDLKMLFMVNAGLWLLLAMIWRRESPIDVMLWMAFFGLFIINAIYAAPYAVHLAGGSV